MSRQLSGTVTSDKGDKTIIINVRIRKTHPLYKKQYTVNTKFMAHDDKNLAKIGDMVVISENRPISSRKRYRLVKIVERGGIRFTETDAIADVPKIDKLADKKPLSLYKKKRSSGSKPTASSVKAKKLDQSAKPKETAE